MRLLHEAAAAAFFEHKHWWLWVLAFARTTDGSQQKARPIRPGFSLQIRGSRLRRFVRNGGIVTFGVDIVAFCVTFGTGFGLGLGAAARALGELAFDFLHRLGLGRMLD